MFWQIKQIVFSWVSEIAKHTRKMDNNKGKSSTIAPNRAHGSNLSDEQTEASRMFRPQYVHIVPVVRSTIVIPNRAITGQNTEGP
jgi:hypothetical protein